MYPYQLQINTYILENTDLIPIKFGTALVGNILRPFVYFNRPKRMLSLAQFIDNNPILGETHNYKMEQRQKYEYEMIFDLHEMSKNADEEGKETAPYIDYIYSCINMYAHMCMTGNSDAIRLIRELGLDNEHILLCIHEDKEKLIMHEKLKQIYMFLVKMLYISNDSLCTKIDFQNRCYIWEKLTSEAEDLAEEKEYFFPPKEKKKKKRGLT